MHKCASVSKWSIDISFSFVSNCHFRKTVVLVLHPNLRLKRPAVCHLHFVGDQPLVIPLHVGDRLEYSPS